MEEWTANDAMHAQSKGWDLFTVWDQDKKRTEYAIQRHLTKAPNGEWFGPLPSDEKAREFVQRSAQAGDQVATKALRMFFVSRVKGVPKKEKRKTK